MHPLLLPIHPRNSYQTKAPTKPKTGKNPKNGKGTPVVLTPSPGSIVAPGFVVNESLVIPPVSNIETPLPIIGLASPLAPLTSIPGPRGPAGPVGPVGLQGTSHSGNICESELFLIVLQNLFQESRAQQVPLVKLV